MLRMTGLVKWRLTLEWSVPVVSFLKKRLQQLSKDFKWEKQLVLLVWVVR